MKKKKNGVKIKEKIEVEEGGAGGVLHADREKEKNSNQWSTKFNSIFC